MLSVGSRVRLVKELVPNPNSYHHSWFTGVLTVVGIGENTVYARDINSIPDDGPWVYVAFESTPKLKIGVLERFLAPLSYWNQGNTWSNHEEALVRDAWTSGRSLDSIATERGRTHGGILARMYRMAMISDEERLVLSQNPTANATGLAVLMLPTRYYPTITTSNNKVVHNTGQSFDSMAEAKRWLRQQPFNANSRYAVTRIEGDAGSIELLKTEDFRPEPKRVSFKISGDIWYDPVPSSGNPKEPMEAIEAALKTLTGVKSVRLEEMSFTEGAY